MLPRNMVIRALYLWFACATCTCLTDGALAEAPPARPGLLQIRIAPQRPSGNTTVEPQFSVGLQLADRQEVIKVTRAAEHIAREDYQPAIVMLQSVLNGPDNVAIAATKTERNILLNIRFQAERMIANLPADAHAAYELVAGGDARHQLDAAVDQQDFNALTTVSSHYLHTQAGYEATLLLAFGYRDQGRPLDAAWCIERAMKSRAHKQTATAGLALHAAIAWHAAGDLPRATAKLHTLKSAAERGTIEVAGKQVTLFRNEETALQWLTQLLGIQDLHTVSPTLPLHNVAPQVAQALEKITWQESTSVLDVDATGMPFRGRGNLDVTRQVHDVENTLQRDKLPVVPLTVPHLTGNTLVLRTPDKLQAREVTTGEVLWEQRYSKPFSQVLTGDVKPLPGNRGSILNPMLRDRIFTNATYNQVAVGAERVFCISDHGFSNPGVTGQPNAIIGLSTSRTRSAGHPLTTAKFNHLNAISIATGKLLWRLGEPVDSDKTDFSGHYFLGAPLLLAGQLYCLAEVQREIHLLVLNPVDGEIQWSKALHGCALPVEQSPHRGHVGLTPQYVDGQLICPGGNAVVAVDGATRQITWTHRYAEAENNTTRLRMQRQIMLARIAAMQGKPAPAAPGPGSWLTTELMVFPKVVVLAPRDHNELFCLNSQNGSLLWKRPREDGLFLVNVDENRLLIVGTQTVQLVGLQDGKPAWPKPVKISTPSGSGLLADSKYYLPLNRRAIATIDLQQGQAQTHPLDSEFSLGNLIWQNGHLISQRADSIQVHRLSGEPETSADRD